MNGPVPTGAGLGSASQKIHVNRPASASDREVHADDFKLNLRKARPESSVDAGVLQARGQPDSQTDEGVQATRVDFDLLLDAGPIARPVEEWVEVLPTGANGQPPASVANGCYFDTGEAQLVMNMPLVGEATKTAGRQPAVKGAAAQTVGRQPAMEGDVPDGAGGRKAATVHRSPELMQVVGQLPPLEGRVLVRDATHVLPAISVQAAGSIVGGDQQVPLPGEVGRAMLVGIHLQAGVSAGRGADQAGLWEAALGRRVQGISDPAPLPPIAEQWVGAPELVAGSLQGSDKTPVARQIVDFLVKENEVVQLDNRLASYDPAHAAGGVRRLSLDLMPAHLGKLRIELSRSASGELAVTITASSEQSAELIRRQLNELLETLKGSSVELGSVLVQAIDVARSANFVTPGQMLHDAASQAGEQHRDTTGQTAQEVADEATIAKGHCDDDSSAGGPDGVYI